MVKGAKTLLMLIMALILAVPLCFAVTSVGHVQLLAVYQENGEFKGSPADVQLEIKEGTGRVFLETIPLSKVDTQISTRFAKQMACQLADVDCNKYDFFYTIKSPAGIVGGPSAGGAISALTVAMLLELEIDQDLAMTGTINSGGLIGPVGSLKEKIDAASESKITKVLIPAVQAGKEEGNITNLAEYGKEKGVEVVAVNTLSESVQEITGEVFDETEIEIDISEMYTDVMKEVSKQLCDRSNELLGEINVFDLSDKKKIEFKEVVQQKELQELKDKGKIAFEEKNYYSAASYCFGASVKASNLLYELKNMTDEETAEEAKLLAINIDDIDRIAESKEKRTITDLQTYMIVKERILEAKQALAEGNNDSQSFGYVNERTNSAVAWSQFFDNGGNEYELDEESLKESCTEILADVEERFQYLNLFFPGLLENLKKNIIEAHNHQKTGEHALCIYLASKTKAEANIIVTMLGVKEDYVPDLAELKINAAKRAVTNQISKGVFPIIAYSYYEYSTSLKETDVHSSMLYSEYALELSDIDIYFEKKEKSFDWSRAREILKEYVPTVTFIWGLLLGYLLCWILKRENARERIVPATKVKQVKVKPKKKKMTQTSLRLR